MAGTESLFTTQVPALPNINDNVAYNLGTVFTAAVAGNASGVRWRFPDTLPTGTVIGALYQWVTDISGILLAQANFVNPVAGSWNSAVFASPVAIDPTKRYVAVIRTPDRYVATNNFFTADLVSGNLRSPAPVVGVQNGKYGTPAPALAYPDANGNSANYFADVLFGAPQSAITISRATETYTAGKISLNSQRIMIRKAREYAYAAHLGLPRVPAITANVAPGTASVVIPAHTTPDVTVNLTVPKITIAV